MINRIISMSSVVLLLSGLCHADPRFASLKLTSQPDSAFVRIDNMMRGQTPLEIPDLGPGKHALRLWKAGYQVYERTLKFELGKRQVGDIKLVPLTQAGLDSARRAGVANDLVFPAKYPRSTLKLTTQPEGADVWLAGDAPGKTPLLVGNIIPGRRALRVSKYGYRAITREIDFKSATAVELNLALEPMTTEQLDSAQAAADARKARAESLRALPRDTIRAARAAEDKRPEQLVAPQPPYPALTKAKRIEGKVVVAMLIDNSGRVVAAEIDKSSGDETLDQAAREAALQWQFTPVAPGSKQYRPWFKQTFTFSLN
jgi:TonB family protein